LTPKLIPIFEQVLGPPDEQLEDETRVILHQIIQALFKAKPDLFRGHEVMLRLADVA
jgi:hypothetical protein